jgi:hypothetical protein
MRGKSAELQARAKAAAERRKVAGVGTDKKARSMNQGDLPPAAKAPKAPGGRSQSVRKSDEAG